MKNQTLSEAAGLASELNDLLTQAQIQPTREAIHIMTQCEARAAKLKALVGQFLESDHN